MAGDEAEDLGQILSLDETIVTPFGTFTQCLKTLDTDALEPGLETQVVRPRCGGCCRTGVQGW